MNDEEKLRELERRIGILSSEIRDSEQKLRWLQKELINLKNGGDSPVHTGFKRPQGQNFRLENFIGLRVIHLVGIVVLVIGLSIGVKYAIDRQLISELGRIILAYTAGVFLYLLSRKLKTRYKLFSAILFSGAMASLYFTTYAAFVYYGFFPFALTYLLMAGLTIYTSFEAIRYNRQEIAVLGMVGAYGIPFLISRNTESADLFFSYIIVINVGVVYLSFRKKWKIMGQLALLISWTLFLLWGFFRYDAMDFWTGFILVGTFFFLFSVSALAYRLVRSEALKVIDVQQLTANNIAFYLSALIVFGFGEFGTHLASTTGWIFLLLMVFALSSKFFFPSEILLQRTLAIQSFILVAMYIGFEWSGLTVTLLWLLLAVTLFILGLYLHRSWPRMASILLFAVTLLKLVILDSSRFTTLQKIIAYIITGSLLLVLSFLYQKYKKTIFQNQEATAKGDP